MTNKELKFVVDTTVNFFKETTGMSAECGIPYTKNGSPVMLEYSGIIGISGLRKGSIYFTSNQNLLQEMARRMLDGEEVGCDEFKDLSGEIANTISGNLRKVFGSDFHISVPVIVEGQARDIKLPKDIDAYIIPITWKENKAFLVVGLE